MATKKKKVKPVVIEVAEEKKTKKRVTEKQLANLKPFQDLTESEQRKLAVAGGKASGVARRERKTLRESLLLMLEQGNMQDDITLALLDKARRGDTRAYEVMRDTIGEKPVEQTQNINFDVSYEDYMKKLNEDKEW